MSFALCAFIGVAIGAVAHRLFPDEGWGLRIDATAGVAGALLGGGFVVVVDDLAFSVVSLWSGAFALLGGMAAVALQRAFWTREGGVR